MTQILMLTANPNPNSLTHRLAHSFMQGCEDAGGKVDHWDLYQEGFDPVLGAEELKGWFDGKLPATIRAAQDRLMAADELAFFYPTWWYDRPAILKGWCDRVLTYGFAFKGEAEGALGMLPHQRAWVVQNSGGARESYQQRDCDLVIEKTVADGTLKFCGIKDVRCHTYYGADSVDSKTKDGWVDGMREIAQRALAS